MSDDAHIALVAIRNGGRRFLSAFGEDGTPQLRDAITNFARDGGSGYVADTIESLFGQSDKPLSDTQVSQLGAALVDRWRS
jgi:hypothetical protein